MGNSSHNVLIGTAETNVEYWLRNRYIKMTNYRLNDKNAAFNICSFYVFLPTG